MNYKQLRNHFVRKKAEDISCFPDLCEYLFTCLIKSKIRNPLSGQNIEVVDRINNNKSSFECDCLVFTPNINNNKGKHTAHYLFEAKSSLARHGVNNEKIEKQTERQKYFLSKTLRIDTSIMKIIKVRIIRPDRQDEWIDDRKLCYDKIQRMNIQDFKTFNTDQRLTISYTDLFQWAKDNHKWIDQFEDIYTQALTKKLKERRELK